MGETPEPASVFAHQLPFNVIPHIDKFLDDKYTKEERKVMTASHTTSWIPRQLLEPAPLPGSCTTSWIPRHFLDPTPPPGRRMYVFTL